MNGMEKMGRRGDMWIGDCPARGRVLVGYADVRTVVNLEPGVVVVWWDCPCGADHLTATGRVAERDVERGHRAVRAVRARLDAGA